MAENRDYWSTNGEYGNIRISEEVVASIASIAAAEIAGVNALSGSLTGDIAELLGKKNLTKGVKVKFDGDNVAIDVSLSVIFGFIIHEVAKNVQEAIKTSVESMTGLVASDVNVHVTAICFETREEVVEEIAKEDIEVEILMDEDDNSEN